MAVTARQKNILATVAALAVIGISLGAIAHGVTDHMRRPVDLQGCINRSYVEHGQRAQFQDNNWITAQYYVFANKRSDAMLTRELLACKEIFE